MEFLDVIDQVNVPQNFKRYILSFSVFWLLHTKLQALDTSNANFQAIPLMLLVFSVNTPFLQMFRRFHLHFAFAFGIALPQV